ncbi:MAG: hypothetical protein Q4G40_09960 [Brachybacterium sp.]|nr:hypothetical protein [Brachybacterium sp.]
MIGTQAERTYRAAWERSGERKPAINDHRMVAAILAPDEIVHAVVPGSEVSDTFPLLLVTDRRTLSTRDTWRGWKVLDEIPASLVTGATYTRRGWRKDVLSVHAWGRDDLRLLTSRRTGGAQLVAMLEHLIAGGEPPPAG